MAATLQPLLELEGGAVTLDELLTSAGYISLHLPKTKDSAGMIGKDQFLAKVLEK